MIRTEVLERIGALSEKDEEQWMVALGAELTIAAREAYVPGELAADAPRLMGYNELQHQIYGRLVSFHDQHKWTQESFVDGLMERARLYKIEGGLIYAFERSLRLRSG